MNSVLIMFLGLMVCVYGQEEVTINVDLSTVVKLITDKLTAQGEMLEQLKEENAVLKEQQAACMKSIENLTASAYPVKHRVAFTATLGKIDSTGSKQKHLIFPNVLTNIGGAYSSNTGMFEAPLKGAYYFRFTVTDELDGRYMGIQMYKNEEKILWLSEYDDDGKRTYISSGVTLELEAGDKVNMRIPAGGHALFDDYNNHCIFTGFLLFPL